MKNTLYYFEDSASTGFGWSDLELLGDAFEHAVVFPDPSAVNTEYPSKYKNAGSYIRWDEFKPSGIIFRNIFGILNALLLCSSELGFSSKKWKEALKKLVSNIFRAEAILAFIRESGYDKNSICMYAFWFYDSTFLAWLKYKHPEFLVINRAHGGDIFEEQTTLRNKVLLRNFQFRYIDRIATVSKDGCDYLQKRYPNFASKISTRYLGTLSHADINEYPESEFVLVSCSHIRDIKRVDKIAETVFLSDFPIIWYHLGSENVEAKDTDKSVEKYMYWKSRFPENKNVKFYAKGSVLQKDVYDFYRKNAVSLFISLSETEGLPVSMMEATSFGIPVLSTDVGGCREVATEKTGVLVPENIQASEVLEEIKKFRKSKLNSINSREAIKEYWEHHFDIQKNYNQIIHWMKNN